MTNEKRRWGKLFDKANERSGYGEALHRRLFLAFAQMLKETRRAVKGGVRREVWELGLQRTCG